MPTNSLYELAKLYGIYLDPQNEAAGKPGAADGLLISALQAVGLSITEPDEAEHHLQQVHKQRWQQLLDPVLVLQEKEESVSIPVRLPVAEHRQYHWTIAEESSMEHHGDFKPSEMPVDSTELLNGHEYGIHHLDLQICLPCGYHHLTIRIADQTNDDATISQLLIITPRHCYVPPGISGDSRVWGVHLYLHAIRSRTNWGVGDFSNLKQLLNWAATHGAGTIHTAPLYSIHAGISDEWNPYAPSCRCRLNILYLDVEAIADFSENEEIKVHCRKAGFQAKLASLRHQEQIDYDAVFRKKEELFKKLWNHFSINHLNPETARGNDFRHFQQQEGKTLYYFAIFAVIADELGVCGHQKEDLNHWPHELRDPSSEAVAEFARHHENEIEYHQYLQWQAELQLAVIGRRSMELGLKVGLLREFPYSPGGSGFESWYYNKLQLQDACIVQDSSDDPLIDPAVGLPLFLPRKLQENLYKPVIEGLRHTMCHAGALIVRSMANYFQTSFSLNGQSHRAFVRYSFSDLVGILALESRRNRCLIIADSTINMLPKEQQRELQQRNIFSSTVLFQDRNTQGKWLEPADYPSNSVIAATSPFLASMKGIWQGYDIAIKTREKLFQDDHAKEKAILTRASDRAHFLISLDHSGLLPEGYGLDPASVPELDSALITAGQIFLARTPAKILLVALNDILGMEEHAEPPALTKQPFWAIRYTDDLETIVASKEIETLFKALCLVRGAGVVRPSAQVAERKERRGLRIPSSFYRLQLNKDFTFIHAAAIIPYLKRLGISHCYISPLLMARPGSLHGYDIINHTAINPEIGSREDFEVFIKVLEQHKMALILDIVPNHMGIGSDNQWWMDVLENGEISPFSNFFDINWQPQQPDLSGRVLLPVLGDHYGKILESGQLTLCFDVNKGSFFIHYYDHRFPVTPKSFPTILDHDLDRLSDRLGKQHNGYLELQNLISSFHNLSDRREISDEKIQIYKQDKEINKRLLARLCREQQEIRQFVEENVSLFNGEKGKPERYDLLHDLLEKQAYRLAFWRVAADEINYRRFFDINDLAGLRVEEEQVFQQTHSFVLDLIATGKVDGLRIDHPDGLNDPLQYFSRLQAAATSDIQDQAALNQRVFSANDGIPLYVVAEKILADFEFLPEAWPVNGTTGYDFSNLLNGLLLEAEAEKPMTALYHQFIGKRLDPDALLYNNKKLIIRASMAGELNVLASLLYRIAQANRTTRDFTYNRLRDDLIEIVACFPVYRTYITSAIITKNDVNFIEWAVAKARSSKQLDDSSTFDFIKTVLLLKDTAVTNDLAKRLDFVRKFQQYTGPVMAKGLEDTTFYIYNRLLSLNEVGGGLKRFGLSVAAFHHTNQDRLQYWPHSMLNSSTHDSKRSEDVRARINVLTEMAAEWKRQVFRWSKLNRPLKTQLKELRAPDRNDEYAFYQNLLGVWSGDPLDEASRRDLFNRIKNAMVKTCREAKIHTSWINPNQSYEDAIVHFVEGVLSGPDSAFMTEFLAFQQEISWFGMLNSLSQAFLKLVVPGIPDIYQGCELWRFSMVDPDNRRPVDFQKRQAMLFPMLDRLKDRAEKALLQKELLANLQDGRAKMYLIAQTLSLRNSWPDVFMQGSYLPLEVTGVKSRHICAFARKNGRRMIIAVAPMLYMTLMQGEKHLPLGNTVWKDTVVNLPQELVGRKVENIYWDGSEKSTEVVSSSTHMQVGHLLQSWPVALLKGTISG
ncbi:MAG: malto-oligosyltrehalose synthase [Desulfocapsa sp.]|nr:malto-oligosyltrehalose synthase [Desulfocapsa sp.]